jgi:hypothetical protein
MGVALGRGRVGIPTRGKTARNRLRRLDVWVARDGALRTVASPLFVDVGYGAEPSTTIESFTRLSHTTPGLRVIGVEIDRARVEAAEPFVRAGLEFRLGGFDLPLLPREAATVVRAMNVLRQYDESAHADAIARLGRALHDGGVLLEGTSSPTGRLLTANVYRRRDRELMHDGLLLAPNLARQWTPRELQTVLPKNFVHRCVAGSSLDDFFGRWERAYDEARRRGLSPRAAFTGSVDGLGDLVGRNPSAIRRGFVLMRLPK